MPFYQTVGGHLFCFLLKKMKLASYFTKLLNMLLFFFLLPFCGGARGAASSAWGNGSTRESRVCARDAVKISRLMKMGTWSLVSGSRWMATLRWREAAKVRGALKKLRYWIRVRKNAISWFQIPIAPQQFKLHKQAASEKFSWSIMTMISWKRPSNPGLNELRLLSSGSLHSSW